MPTSTISSVFDSCYFEVLAKQRTDQMQDRSLLGNEMGVRTICPNSGYIQRAIKDLDNRDIKVVILGQDPYHIPGVADGLAFSSRKPGYWPKSLRNIAKELLDDTGIKLPSHELSAWHDQGVLLLNTALTTYVNEAGAHLNLWKPLLNKVMDTLGSQKNLAWLLWGTHAQKAYYEHFPVDKEGHLVLQCAHPSPLSAHRGFFGCRHFSKVNTFLEEKGLDKIDWGRDPSGQEVAEEQPNPSVVIPHRTLYTSRTR
jgi:uracil-DNA glycosylase